MPHKADNEKVVFRLVFLFFFCVGAHSERNQKPEATTDKQQILRDARISVSLRKIQLQVQSS